MEETLDRDRQRIKEIGHLRVLKPKWMSESSKTRKSVYVRLQCQLDVGLDFLYFPFPSLLLLAEYISSDLYVLKRQVLVRRTLRWLEQFS